MHKNNFFSIPNKTLKYEESITMCQSILSKINDNDNNKNKILSKLLKEYFHNKDFIPKNYKISKVNNESQNIKNYFFSKQILKKYTYNKRNNIELIIINNITKKGDIFQTFNAIFRKTGF